MTEHAKNEQGNNKWFKMNSVKTKLITIMTLLAIVPTTTLGFVSNQYVENTMQEDVASNTLQVTEQVNHSIDNLILGVESQINLLANNINFQEFYQNPENEKYGFILLEGTGKSRSDYQAVYFASAKKDFVLYPKQELEDGYDPTVRPWYKEAVMANGEAVVGKPYIDANTKETTVTMSKAVVNNGVLIGVIGIDLDLDELAKQTNSIVVGEKGYAFILANDGTAIAHKDKNVVGTKKQTQLKLWNDVSSHKKGHSEYILKENEQFATFDTNEKTGWKVISNLEQKEIEDHAKRIRTISMILMIAFGLISTIVAYLFGRKIANNLREVQTAFKTASDGDLTIRVYVKANDEFKELERDFNHMMEGLSLALQNVEKSSKNVLHTSSNLSVMTAETSASVYEVAQAIGEIAHGATLQADNAHTGTIQMNDLSERLNGIENSTSNMKEASQRSTELGHKGLEQVVLLTEKSIHAKQSTVEVGEIVKEVDNKMEDINKIIETISQITDQTNLLALNAQIESARAGEFGRGFAVVANEVRTLAEQSKKSAKEIKEIVENIKSVVTKAVVAMEQTHHVVSEQEIAVNETKEIFTDILNAVNEMVEKSDEVIDSLLESQQNKEAVVRKIETISAVSQQTASATEEVSASAEEISATMEEFNRHANGLKTVSELLENEIKKFILN